MSANLDQEEMQTVERASELIKAIVVFEAALLIGVFVLSHVFGLDFFRKPVLSTLTAAFPQINGGTFFYFTLAIVATGFGSYGFACRSWSLIVLGFWAVIVQLTAVVVSSIWFALTGAWHLLATLFYFISEWGFKSMTEYHCVGFLFSAGAIVVAFFLFKTVLPSLKPAFLGTLTLGRAQEIDSGLMDFLEPFEGLNRTEVLALLFRNSLAKFVTYSLVGHFAFITLFSIPGFIQKAQNAWYETKEAVGEETTDDKKDEAKPAEGDGETKEGGDGEEGDEPAPGFNTPGATETTDDDDIDMDDADKLPSGDSGDYDKHKGKPEDDDDDDDLDDLGGLEDGKMGL